MKLFYQSNSSLDWLSIRLNRHLINPILFSCVDNSPVRDLFDIINFEFKIQYDGFYVSHTTYYITDYKNNRIAQIILESDNNKKHDIYDKITFYGLYFNLYQDYLYYIQDKIFIFFGITLESKITRVDIKKDVEVDRLNFKFKDILKEKIKGYGTTWQSYKNDNNGYEFRTYDKNLDYSDNYMNIQDNFGNYIFRDLVYYNLENNINITRLECQLNSRYIRNNKITLKDVLSQKFIDDKINNLYFQNFNQSDFIYTPVRYTRDDVNFQIKESLDVKYERNTNMSQVYLKKLIEQNPMNYKKTLSIIFDNLKIEKNEIFQDYLLHIDYKKTLSHQINLDKIKFYKNNFNNIRNKIFNCNSFEDFQKLKNELKFIKEIEKTFDN